MSRCGSFGLGAFGGILLVALAAATPTTMLAGAPKGLKYQFKSGQSYIYQLTIVAELPDTIETYKGHLELAVKSADSNETRMAPSLHLPKQVKSKRNPAPGGAPGAVGPAAFSGGRELTIDAHGAVVRATEDNQLPFLLGPAAQMVIEPLSSKGETRWERGTDISIREAQQSSFPFPKFKAPKFKGAPANETTSAARETVTYELAGTDKIKKTYELKTVAQEDGTPRLQLKGTGEIVFDAQAGMAKSGAHKLTLVLSERNTTVRVPITIEYRVMPEAEASAFKKEQEELRAKAAEAARIAALPKAVSDNEITQALTDLKSNNKFAVMGAAQRLSKAIPVDARRAEVAGQLEALLKDKDGQIRSGAAGALKVWATSKSAPALMAALKDDWIFTRFAAFDAIGTLKDPKAAEAVAEQVPDFRVRGNASGALKAMGAIAEKAVLPLLKHQDLFVRVEACKILAEIGTKESLAPLQAVVADTNGLVRNEATKAVKAVEGRGK